MLNDSHQNVTIITDPPGAACSEVSEAPRRTNLRLLTEGTPATVRVFRYGTPLVISCSKDGFVTTRISLQAVLSPAAIGTLLMFGPGGFALEANSPRRNAYPGVVRMTLPPAVEDNSAS